MKLNIKTVGSDCGYSYVDQDEFEGNGTTIEELICEMNEWSMDEFEHRLKSGKWISGGILSKTIPSEGYKFQSDVCYVLYTLDQ